MPEQQEMLLVEEHLVPPMDEPQRLSDFLPGIFTYINSRKGIKKAIKKGLVKVNNETGHTGRWIKGGETIALYRKAEIDKNILVEIPLHVFYEDSYLAIVRKPAGIAVSGNKKRTLEHALPYNLQAGEQHDALLIPQAIHRLDYPTSGVLLIGKTIQAVSVLNRMFAERKIEKKYIVATIGEMPQNGTIEAPIDNKAAKTTYKVLEIADSEGFDKLNLVEIETKTGRKHQIRKHMFSIGNPVLGDQIYKIEGKRLKGKGLYLHAISLSFKHPFTKKEIDIHDEIPQKFKKIFPTSNK